MDDGNKGVMDEIRELERVKWMKIGIIMGGNEMRGRGSEKKK
jgi:hypothetical protein